MRKGKRTCTQHPISNFVSFKRLSPSYGVFASMLTDIQILKNVQEALAQSNWKRAVIKESPSSGKNKTWDYVRLPAGKTLVGCKWVFIVKHNAGEV